MSILVGKTPRTVATMVDFLMVKAHSSYNAILERLTLNNLRAITSMFHLKMKFSTCTGVGEIRCEQVLVRDCYDRELWQEAKEVRTLEGVREDAYSPLATP